MIARATAVIPLPSIRKLFPLVSLLYVALLAGCSYVPMLPGISPYRIDIQQGNYVTQDMLDKVKPGMSKSQVRFALGTPLVVDPFHSDRWDYIYELQKRGRLVEHRRLFVVFQDDKLVRIEGDVAPASPAANPSAALTGGAVAAPPSTVETKNAAAAEPQAPASPVTGIAAEPAAPAGTALPAEKPSQP